MPVVAHKKKEGVKLGSEGFFWGGGGNWKEDVFSMPYRRVWRSFVRIYLRLILTQSTVVLNTYQHFIIWWT